MSVTPLWYKCQRKQFHKFDFGIWGKQYIFKSTVKYYLIVFIFPLKCIWTNNSFCKMADRMDHSSWPRDQSAASSLVYSACRIAEIWGRRRCWMASTLIRKYFLFSWDKAGREMMTDTSGLSVFSKYILAFWITSVSFHYLYRLFLQLICALIHSTALIKTFWIVLFFVENRVEFIQLLDTNCTLSKLD